MIRPLLSGVRDLQDDAPINYKVVLHESKTAI